MFNFLMSLTCFEAEGSFSRRRPYTQLCYSTEHTLLPTKLLTPMHIKSAVRTLLAFVFSAMHSTCIARFVLCEFPNVFVLSRYSSGSFSVWASIVKAIIALKSVISTYSLARQNDEILEEPTFLFCSQNFHRSGAHRNPQHKHFYMFGHTN